MWIKTEVHAIQLRVFRDGRRKAWTKAEKQALEGLLKQEGYFIKPLGQHDDEGREILTHIDEVKGKLEPLRAAIEKIDDKAELQYEYYLIPGSCHRWKTAYPEWKPPVDEETEGEDEVFTSH